ncbi:GNAT family N-acetyltransferase [Occultella glacieicola]|uniref:GNAT family N-acetyltransferase n=1 Tax=Occultella glacieicola TaxID=2518684 RepID=UPI001404E0AA|nr:GNAT family N-acetyltransferase [Occultella glacieicola]
MSVRELRATGQRAQELATCLLQRARRADPTAGLWEAADVQWWWRSPRSSDDVERVFWFDDDGPLAGVLLSSWAGGRTWQCDPVVVPGTTGPSPEFVWDRALDHAATHGSNGFVVPVRDDDATFVALANRSALTPGDHDRTAWMAPVDRPAVPRPAEGFVLTDRTQRPEAPHPMRERNGDDVADRLGQCSLYDPELDLAVESTGGQLAGYALFWFDPVTLVGLVEPVRIEDEFQRRGLARAMVSAGVDRLVARGAERIKVSYETEAAGSLYLGVGFEQESTATWYRSPDE